MHLDGRNPAPGAKPWADHYARTLDLAVEHAVRGTDRPALPHSDVDRLRWTDSGHRSRGFAVLTADDAITWLRRLSDGRLAPTCSSGPGRGDAPRSRRASRRAGLDVVARPERTLSLT